MALPDDLGGFNAIEDGHLAVHEDEVEVLFFECVDGFLPVFCNFEGAAEVLEDALHDELVSSVVLDDEDSALITIIVQANTRGIVVQVLVSDPVHKVDDMWKEEGLG